MRTSLSSRREIVDAAKQECRWERRLFFATVVISLVMCTLTGILCLFDIIGQKKVETLMLIFGGSGTGVLAMGGLFQMVYSKTLDVMSKG